MNIATLTQLLKEAEHHHGFYEAIAPKHHWSDWYAAFIAARQDGRTVDEAKSAAALHMKEVLQ